MKIFLIWYFLGALSCQRSPDQELPKPQKEEKVPGWKKPGKESVEVNFSPAKKRKEIP